MSHEITEQDSMVSGMGKTPWHGLGTVVEGRLSALEALELANLHWKVNQEPIYTEDMELITTHQLNRRSDTGTILGIVGKDWTPIQNTFLVEIAEALGQAGTDFKPVIETAGSLKGGRIVWALITTSERYFADSDHRSYLLLSNGHDGSRAVRGTMTDVRVVCNNTLTCAETQKSSLFVRHTKNVAVRLQDAIELLGWANDATDATFAIYEALAKAPIHVDYLVKNIYTPIVEKHCGWKEDSDRIPEAVDQMVYLFRNGKGNEGKTAFDALNGLTDWVDHQRAFAESDSMQEVKFLYTTQGHGATIKRQGAKVLNAYAENWDAHFPF